MKEPSIEEQLVREWVGSVTVTEEMHNAGVIWLEAVVGEVTKGLQSERRKAALECLKARIEGFDIAYDCYDYKRLNKLKTSWNEELASLESNTEKEK